MAGQREPSPRWTDQDRLEILRQLDGSGVGVKEFARRAGVGWSTPYEWRRRLARDTGSGVVSGSDRGEAKFAEVRVVQGPGRGGCPRERGAAREDRGSRTRTRRTRRSRAKREVVRSGDLATHRTQPQGVARNRIQLQSAWDCYRWCYRSRGRGPKSRIPQALRSTPAVS